MASKKPIAVYATIGQRLMAIRKQRNLTQEKFGALIGFDQSNYTQLERGLHGLYLSKLVVVAAKLGVTVGYLIGETELTTTPTRKQIVITVTGGSLQVTEESGDVTNIEGLKLHIKELEGKLDKIKSQLQ